MFKKYKLKNGMRVILAPLHETKAITALILVKVGSRYEQRSINGASHFVEHLMFKGTKKRPTALSITKELDGIGAEFNAFTSKDHTGYYIKANFEKLELALDILSDIIYNSKFVAKETERERGVIIEEINMYEDNPMMMMEDLFEQTVFGDHPLGWNISGPKSVINKISREKLYQYYRKYYRPQNILLTVAGNFDTKVNNLIEHYFGVKPQAKSPSSFQKIIIQQKKPQIKVKYKDTEQVQLGLGFPAYSYTTSKLYPLYLLTVILGGNMSSRLFMSIREKKGLCYFIRAGVNAYQDSGTLMIQAGVDKQRVHEAIKAILKELKKIKVSGVTEAELRKAKDYLKGKLILDLESSEHVASWLSRQELLQNRVLTPTQQIQRLEKVKLADIKKVSNEIINTRSLNISLIGPFKSAESFKDVLQV
ncbi:insulinase family protein [Patescibacteria group bacterium]|nr:insulinase family protein [Patescibacteria group bacterium]